jgi:hypothetical protein
MQIHDNFKTLHQSVDEARAHDMHHVHHMDIQIAHCTAYNISQHRKHCGRIGAASSRHSCSARGIAWHSCACLFTFGDEQKLVVIVEILKREGSDQAVHGVVWKPPSIHLVQVGLALAP